MANTTIDWSRKVREFRNTHGFPNEESALEWLVERDSLETILGLVGAEVIGDQSKLKPWLLSLGAWLKERGYKVPPIYCPTNSYAYDSQTRVGEDVSITKKMSIRSSERSETPQEYPRKVLLNLTLTEAVIKESINALVEIAPALEMEPSWDTVTTDEVMHVLAVAKYRGEDIATELVKRLREVAN